MTAALLAQILAGHYPPGNRLPPERELAQELGTSRVSVRSAISRLTEWGVVSARQGSGISVRPRRRWGAGVLGSVVEHALARGEWETLIPLIVDARSLRRSVVMDMLDRAAAHFAAHPPAPGTHPLDTARAVVDAAWASRDDTEEFLTIDSQALPAVLEAAQMLPSLFLVNSLTAPYLSVMRAVVARAPVADDYRARQYCVLDAVERGEVKAVRRLATEFLDELERQIFGFLPEEVRRVLL